MFSNAPIINDGGLICGYILRSDGALHHLDWQEVEQIIDERDVSIWLHFNLADMRAKRWLETCPAIPRRAKEILLGNSHQMILEPVEHGLVGVLGDLHHEFDSDPSKIGVLRLYLDNRLLVSARHHPLKSVDSLRQSIVAGTQAAKPVNLMIRLLHHLAETFGATITDLGETIDRIEDHLLDDRISNESNQLGRARQLIVRLRRYLVPQRHALIGLLNRLPAWLSRDDKDALRQAVERLDMLGHDLDLVQDRARLLQDELANKQAERTNHNLYILSILTTIFLPITLITGIFGMNVGGLPGVQSDIGFTGVMLLMLVTVIVSLGLLYWKRLF